MKTNITSHKKSKLKPSLIIILSLIIGTAILDGCTVESAVRPVSNETQVIESIRNGMREHSSRINIRFTSSESFNATDLTEWGMNLVEAALADTENPREGDYIRYQNGGYKINVASEGDEYTVSIEPKYYLYHIQEQEASEAIEEAMAEFNFDDNTSDYDKIKTIYDYICSNIKYDYFHDGLKQYTLRSTIYGGMVKKSATCQGYCVTLYCMLKEAGIENRIVTGQGRLEGADGLHAWNIVELDGKYYCLDATWDAQRGEDGVGPYEYFLKGSEDFADHVPGEMFKTKDFREQYPMSETSYLL